MRSDQPAGICIPEAFITRLYRRKRNMEEFEFEQELLALHDKLFGYACKLFSEKEEAEDLLQETFLKALVNKNKYNENSNFKGWMYTIMHNTYLNICQDKQHTQRNSLSDDKIFMEVNKEEGLLICNEYDLQFNSDHAAGRIQIPRNSPGVQHTGKPGEKPHFLRKEETERDA